jgi:hypothetical protein
MSESRVPVSELFIRSLLPRNILFACGVGSSHGNKRLERSIYFFINKRMYLTQVNKMKENSLLPKSSIQNCLFFILD